MTETESANSSSDNYELVVHSGKKEEEKNEENALESDGVNLQCINSSDFVVGKQTTFNGPVTIINYAEGHGGEVENTYKPAKEEIVLRQKVITPATVSEIKAFAEKKIGKSKNPEESAEDSNKDGLFRRIFKVQVLKIPVVLWVLLLLVVLIGCLAYFLRIDSLEAPPKTKPRNSRSIRYNGKDYNYYTRQDWNARPPHFVVEMKPPVPYVVISHTASQFCYLDTACMNQLRNIQGDHMNRAPVPYSDIAYSFMVGGDGNIYEGRGWTRKTTTSGFANGKSVNINFIGSFENLDGPTYPQTEAVKALIEYGVNNSFVDKNYFLIADNATYPTLSPGVQVYKIIKHWPHFNPDPKANLTLDE